MTKKSNEGLSAKKQENFSLWFSQILEKAEIIDLRLDIKGFMIFRPWGTQIIENMFNLFEKELQSKNHKPTIMPLVIPEENLQKEASHLGGFTPQVFWIEKFNESRYALRPTSETLFTPMFKLWIRSHRDLPLKLYQRGSVFRLDTKATRPLIRTRELIWIEAHCAFPSKKDAENQVLEDINTTEKVMHQKMGIPFFPFKRPSWDKFPGAVYTIGSDVLMPDGKFIQQPSTHYLGTIFAKAFDAKFTNENGKEEYIHTTAYGPCMSRILVSVISQHSDDKGLILPFCISPKQVVITPIYSQDNKNQILTYCTNIANELEKINIKYEFDKRDYIRPGEKYNYWELLGVPFRIEIGKKELENNTFTLFNRRTGKKEIIKLSNLKNLYSLGEKFDKDLILDADRSIKNKIIDCSSSQEIKKTLDKGFVARTSFCQTTSEGLHCAEFIEKNLNAEVRGTLANKKEKPKESKCAICQANAHETVYIGRTY